ncbi:PLP-dependent aminotransferase family protein [Metabacillus idriensis]|uniref:MocR-like pyridoxine biosynthesis transcription factor PdxR n=1 Tax=Metabacillus idriensis TaxID=324768 RepID=UPI001749099A|nr:PLP-dependent aminotransferase family protein [Metabacillus idriensis]
MTKEWKPDRLSEQPIYKQIVQFFEEQIRNGELPPLSKLPSERRLAEDLGVNRSTVATAYAELSASDLIISKRGSGTLVGEVNQDYSSGRLPNWNRMLIAGTLLPNVPIIQRIAEETHHKNLIDLATGQLSPELFPNEQFQHLLKNQHFDNPLSYDHPHGNMKLRETIAGHLKTYKKIDCTPSSILITSGAQQALHLIIQCLLKPGDTVAIENPSYTYTLPIFKSLGIKTILLEVDEKGVNPQAIHDAYMKHRIRMIFLGSAYQNPTGAVLDSERRKKILSTAYEFGIPIVEDDPYSLLSFENESAATLKSEDSHGIVIYISSLSKMVSSGMRIGWILAPKQIIERLADARQQIDFGSSIFSDWLAREFLKSDFFDPHLHQLKIELKERRDILVSAIEKHLPGQVDYTVPKGGIHLWCRIKPAHHDEKLFNQSVDKGMIYTPGSALGSKKGFVRFTFGRAAKQSINTAISAFSEALLQQK